MSTHPLRLLLIEDSFAVAREFQSLLLGLEGEDLQVQHVETLGQALKLIGPDRFRFDCLLVDLRLSDAEGASCVARLRARDSHTAIIALTAPDDREQAVEALQCGAQEYLIHPWLRTPDLAQDLLRLIRAAIARREQVMAVEPDTGGDDDAAGVFPSDDEARFGLRFQPWAETQGGAICGVEALLAARGVQGSPRAILDAAASRGEMNALSHWVLRRAVPLWREWRSRGIAPTRLAVNVAASELQARHFARSRLGLIEELGLAPQELQIELAEDALHTAGVKALGELQALRGAGITVVADNVGRSQVNVLALGRLPLDGIKFDPVLIESMRHGHRAARAAIRGLVAACDELGMPSCAVGVEVNADDAACRELGVHHLQGYWVARPQSPLATAAWLSRCLPLASATSA